MTAVRLAALALLLIGAGTQRGEPRLKGLNVLIYTARTGENTASLVRRFKTTPGSLQSLNPGVDLDRLNAGDTVRVMSSPGVFQKVGEGLTIADISRAYQVNAEYILRVNELASPKKLQAGFEVFVPDANPLPPSKRNRLIKGRTPRPRPKGTRTYIGKPLDTSNSLVVSCGYGRRRHPITRVYQMHSGIDLVAPWGTPILAVKDGEVTFAGWKGGYGKLVVVQHEKNMESYYSHATEILVKEGEKVVEGQVIARVGATGDVTAPHLHFELRWDGHARNPTRALQRYF